MSVLEFDATQRDIPPGVLLDVEGRLAATAGVLHAADGALVDVMAEVLEGDLWQGDRILTPVQWLMWRAGLGRQKARRVVLLAARRGELPVTASMLRAGRLSLDQAATIARYTPAAFEASVAEAAVEMSVRQIVKATRGYVFDVEARPARNRGQRDVAFGHDDDGDWWGRIRLPVDEGAVVEEALKTVRDRLHETERDAARRRAEAEGRPTSGTDAELGVNKVGWADALVGMAHSVLGHDAEGAESDVRTAVHLHLERPRAGEGAEWIAEMHGGPALPSWLRRYLLCDCDIEIVWNTDGIPVATSRHHRTPPLRVRRLVEKRDGYECRVPGCTQSLWLQVHHIVHWEDQGETVTANLCCLCARHHRMHHQGLLDIDGNADSPAGAPGGLEFYDTVLKRHLEPVGATVTPGPGDMPVVDAYECPSGETWVRTDMLWFAKTEPPPGTGRQPAA